MRTSFREPVRDSARYLTGDRLHHGKSLRETARLAGVSKMTVIRVCNSTEGVPKTPPVKHTLAELVTKGHLRLLKETSEEEKNAER